MAQIDETFPKYVTLMDTGTDQNIFENVLKESDLGLSLSSLGLTQKQIEILHKQGEKYLEKPDILSLKFGISEDLARRALEVLKSSKQVSKLILTPEDKRKIETCLEKTPKVLSHEDIALITEVDEELVAMYLDELPLTEKYKNLIQQKYNMGYTVIDISKLLNIRKEKVSEYIETKFMTFSSEKGKLVFDIITKNCGEMSIFNLRQKIQCKNLKLQDKLYCMLRSENQSEYKIIEVYFSEHEESKDFLKVDMNLTLDDILILKQSNKESVELLSVKLNKVGSVIIGYFHQYLVHPIEKTYFVEVQEKRISNISEAFETKSFSLEDYRTIVTYSFNDIINRFGEKKNMEKSQDLLIELLPLVFYYLKCSLPFEDITRLIASVSGIVLTTHDIFHIIFQLSDPVLRGLCIEHYSFSNAVPLYYPKLSRLPQSETRKVEFEICKELWYCLEQYNGLISFGLGRASWNAVGKSSLLDLIFETDFVKGNPQSSAFHFGSIDIQLTRNLFGEINCSRSESTKWAYIDCHSYSDFKVIQAMCSHLDIALIHVCYDDYIHNKDQLNRELSLFKMKRIYILLRDCDCSEVNIKRERANGTSHVYVSIPSLTQRDSIPYTIFKSLKGILGYEVFHLSFENPNQIRSEFLYQIMQDLNCSVVHVRDLIRDIQNIRNIIQKFEKTNKDPLSILNYYPHYVDFMSSYYKASFEVDQEVIDKLNFNCKAFDEKLRSSPMGDIVKYFNSILEKENSAIILYKLSRELSQLIKQKNIMYTLEILWRENLLFYKYAHDYETNRNLFQTNFSNYVGGGDAFELIDGDNLRFFSKEIDNLLNPYYVKHRDLLEKMSEGKTIKTKSAPIVVSIIGPQNSGKSTLLNYCFGCKFLTSAGRCTKGIYGSLSKLDRPVNLSQSFLILDTEGLDAIERENNKDTSMIHFDRTMVLFCLSVSQVVIINVKGDIGSEMQNLLQICAYSLNRLKVSKVRAPKIFFVLNQQADPDPNKHIGTINLLMEKLNSESDLLEIDGVKISDLIQVSRENLFILPSAFNFQQMNSTIAKLFDSDVVKLSPTIGFAKKCSDLRLAIINELDRMPLDDRVPFQTMSEWMEMAGVIWDTIIKYQDIVQYRNIDELKCGSKLDNIVADLMEKHFYCNQEKFKKLTSELCNVIDYLTTYTTADTLLMKYMFKFDEVFEEYQILCLKEFKSICKNDKLLLKMMYLCDERELNVKRLVYAVRKRYEDLIKFHIKSMLLELKLSENNKNFIDALKNDTSKFFHLSVNEQEDSFKTIWEEVFGFEDTEEEREENFSNLYSIFKMEFSEMENKQVIYQFFRNLDFNLDGIINSLKTDIDARFSQPNEDLTEQYIYPLCTHNVPMKDMEPYNGRCDYSYLCPNKLYKRVAVRLHFSVHTVFKISLSDWVPPECEGLLQYCSGYYNHPDIIWSPNRVSQIYHLGRALKAPGCPTTSTWKKFVEDISTGVEQLLLSNKDVSPATVKQIIHQLCFRIKLLNHEIGYICAGLSNYAVRRLSILVFSYAFKFLLEKKLEIRNRVKKDTKEHVLFNYFIQKIENQKMKEGNWDREWMKKSDKNISTKYCLDFIESVKRGLKTIEQHNLRNILEDACTQVALTHDKILFLAYERVTIELSENSDKEMTNTKNFVVQYICNRSAILQDLFRENWLEVEAILYPIISENLKSVFLKQISDLLSVLSELLHDLEKSCKQMTEVFYCDNYFEFVNLEKCKFAETKKSPFRAINTYFRKYLDPSLTPEEFKLFLLDGFEVDGTEVRMCEAYCLPFKRSLPVLDEHTFRKLVNTQMFNDTELLFNIYEYVKNFKYVLDQEVDSPKLKQDEFQEMIQPLKDEFEANVIGCPNQCPSCGKFCERAIHTNEGKCQIKTGHQISSMGGRVWIENKDRAAVLFMCDDYKDYNRVTLPSGEMEWGEFKDKFCKEWNWDLPNEEKFQSQQLSNPKFMKDVWNKFGPGILQYQYKLTNNLIKFVPYSTHEDIIERLLPNKFSICFVIDGTGSMSQEISRVRLSVGQLIRRFNSKGNTSQFRVVIYRDHCDDKLIETFPDGNQFTCEQNAVEDFLKGVIATGGGDGPEAVLDGLATAATQSDWRLSPRLRNKIIHIFDAPPHGNFPNYASHSSYSSRGNCCCCNQGTLCRFDWDRDVWSKFKECNIEYHAINTAPRQYETESYNFFTKMVMKLFSSLFTLDLVFCNYELKMKKELGVMCDNFQVVGKEVVNDAILKIFIYFEDKDES